MHRPGVVADAQRRLRSKAGEIELIDPGSGEVDRFGGLPTDLISQFALLGSPKNGDLQTSA